MWLPLHRFSVCASVSLCLSLSLLASVASAFYDTDDTVHVLTDSSFPKVVTRPGITVVEFFAPWCGHCQSLAPEYRKVGEALQGIATVAAIDADQHKEMAAKYQIQGFPTIKVFSSDSASPLDYQGARDAKSILTFVMKEVRSTVKRRLEGKSKPQKSGKKKAKKEGKGKGKGKGKAKETDVVELTDDNFEDLVYHSKDLWLVEFFAPWCGHCKKLEPEWRQAAEQLKGNVKLGALDATVHKRKAQEFGIQGFPTIKVFKPQSTSPADAEEYQGPREAQGIVAYAVEKAEKVGAGKQLQEITSQEILEEKCSGEDGTRICILAFLPHISESGKKRREVYLKTIKETMKKSKGPFQFGWIQAMDQGAYEKQFALTFGFPSILALNMKKQRSVVMKGAVTAEGLQRFTKEILSGKEKTVPFESLPPIQTVEPWNGEDYVPEVIEEDAAADEIMQQILKQQAEENEKKEANDEL